MKVLRIGLASQEEVRQLEMPNLANYLLSLPEPMDTERDPTPLRGIDFV
jgi:hypothetical protein